MIIYLLCLKNLHEFDIQESTHICTYIYRDIDIIIKTAHPCHFVPLCKTS